jgi:hypothetical protein
VAVPADTFVRTSLYVAGAAGCVDVEPDVVLVLVELVVVVLPVPAAGAAAAPSAGATYSAWNGSRPIGTLVVGGTWVIGFTTGLTAGLAAFGVRPSVPRGRSAAEGVDEPPLSRK